MTASGSFTRFGSGVLAGLTLLALSAAAGCGSSAPELAAEEEFAAVEPEAEPVETAVETETPEPEPPAEEPLPEFPAEEEAIPEIEGLTDLTELSELDPDIVIIPPEELLTTARNALAAVENGPTKKKSESDIHEEAQIALEALDKLFDSDEATHDERQEAWDVKLKIEYIGILRGWMGFDDRLAETRDRLWGSDFLTEAEYANSLLMKIRLFNAKVPIWQAVDKLAEHSAAFPAGPTPVRMFLSYATELTRRRDYANARKVCNIALFHLKDHPQEAQIETYLAKLESPNSRDVRVTSREAYSPIRRRKDDTQRQLEREVKRMQPMLPLQLDPITRLDKVTSSWHAIKYSYTVTGATREVLKKRAAIQKRVSSQLRQTFSTQLLLDKGVQFNYRYFDTKGSLLFRFSVGK